MRTCRLARNKALQYNGNKAFEKQTARYSAYGNDAYRLNCLHGRKNEIYNAVNDTYDAGAIYIGASKFKDVGNVFKNNYIHDIYLTEDAKGGATVGLYWDDQVSGQTAFGNIFDDNSLGMLVGGGDWNTVDNNIFYKTRASLTYDNRGHGWQQAQTISAGSGCGA